MQDHEILALFHARDEQALRAVNERFGSQCRGIAKQILGSGQDAEECWNDVLLRLWNAIPPAKPSRLAAYICTVTRNAALDRYDGQNAAKRGNSQVPAVLDELADCLPSSEDVEAEVHARETAETVNQMLDKLSPQARRFFVMRYVYMMPVKEIAQQCGCGVSRVKVSLMRSRKALRKLLEGIL